MAPNVTSHARDVNSGNVPTERVDMQEVSAPDSTSRHRVRIAGETDEEAAERESRRDFISAMIWLANKLTPDQREWVLRLARAEAAENKRRSA